MPWTAEKRRAYFKLYRQGPVFKLKSAARRATAAYKAYHLAYSRSAKRRAYMKAYNEVYYGRLDIRAKRLHYMREWIKRYRKREKAEREAKIIKT